jgi:tryptophan-rich sensory protein
VTAEGKNEDRAGVETRPLALALLACALSVVLTTLLDPGDRAFWHQELVRPASVLPDLVAVLLELLRMAGLFVFGVVLYRAQVHLDPPARGVVLGLLLGAVIAQATWNPLLVRLESLEAGVAATGILAGAMVTLVLLLARRERLSSALLLPYAVVALHDFWWARELARLNPEAGGG